MIRKVVIIGANIIYSIFKLFPTKHKITMISRQSNKETLDFKLLREKIEESNLTSNKNGQKVKVVTLCRKLEGGINAKLGEKIKYGIHMLSQMYHISTSKIVILDTYCILISILKHKKNLKVIQMWHSMGTMKKFGYQILDKAEGTKKENADIMRMHKNYDYVFASSLAYANQLAEGFGCELDRIRVFSLPRVDLLTCTEHKNSITKKIEEKYPNVKHKKNILYCPTFRKNEKLLEKEIYNMIDQIDFEKYNLIIKLHPLSKFEINSDKVINDKTFSSMDMLFIADYLISDYSCIIYEAVILNIPIFLFTFDIQKYKNNRGLTIDLKKEIPGIVSSKFDTIIKAIENDEYDPKLIYDFRQKYVTNVENCTEKIVEFLAELLSNEKNSKTN